MRRVTTSAARWKVPAPAAISQNDAVAFNGDLVVEGCELAEVNGTYHGESMEA